jgi:hypothetical protein
MSAEQPAFPELVLLVAVCEQAILALERLEPPPDPDLLPSLRRARELVTTELRLRPREQSG